MHKPILRRPSLGLLFVTLCAGVLYSSWPLGYWLNPVASQGLASNLEATHQPYNWLFVLLDIASGLLVLAASWWLWRLMKKTDLPLLRYAVLGFGLFGLLTAIDALLPIDCVDVLNRCGSVFSDPAFIVHGIVSIGSIVGLTVSIMSVWWLVIRDRQAARSLRWLLHGTMFLWFGFGVVTAALIVEARSSTLSQHLFITVCSLWMVALPYVAWRALQVKQSALDSGESATVGDVFAEPNQPISRRRKPTQ